MFPPLVVAQQCDQTRDLQNLYGLMKTMFDKKKLQCSQQEENLSLAASHIKVLRWMLQKSSEMEDPPAFSEPLQTLARSDNLSTELRSLGFSLCQCYVSNLISFVLQREIAVFFSIARCFPTILKKAAACQISGMYFDCICFVAERGFHLLAPNYSTLLCKGLKMVVHSPPP